MNSNTGAAETQIEQTPNNPQDAEFPPARPQSSSGSSDHTLTGEGAERAITPDLADSGADEEEAVATNWQGQPLTRAILSRYRTKPPFPPAALLVKLPDYWQDLCRDRPYYRPRPMKFIDQIEFLVFADGFVPNFLDAPDQGAQLLAPQNITFVKNQQQVVKMQIAFNFPTGCYGRIIPSLCSVVRGKLTQIQPKQIYTGKRELVISVWSRATFTLKKGHPVATLIIKGRPLGRAS